MGPGLCEEQLVILLGAPGRKGESEASLGGFGQETGASVFPASSDDTWDLPLSYAASWPRLLSLTYFSAS